MKCFPAHWDEDGSLVAGLMGGIMGTAWVWHGDHHGSSLQEVLKDEFGKFGVLTGVAVAS